jgi:hypothetical protein
MNRNTANFLIVAGFLLTFGAVGGIETSVNDQEMLGSALVAILGLGLMYCGMIATRVVDSYRV